MQWVDEIEGRLKAATARDFVTPYEQIMADTDLRTNAPADIAKLIQAVRVAEDALKDAHQHLSQYYNSMFLWSITGQTLARFQYGKFGDGETNA